MTLLERLMTPCARLVPEETPDGLGGRTVTWREGGGFRAALIERGSGEGADAQRLGPREVYRVVTPGDAALEYHDVFRRLSDGRIFRVTGATVRGPECAAADIGVAECEGWVLP